MFNPRGSITDTQTFLRLQLPRHIAGTVVEHTNAINLNQFLRGTARYAKRLGCNGNAVLVADNRTSISQIPLPEGTSIAVSFIPVTFAPGQLLQLGSNEIIRVRSDASGINYVTNQIMFDVKIEGKYSINDTVDLYGEFCQVSGDAVSGQPYIVVYSPKKIYVGDVIRIDYSTESNLFAAEDSMATAQDRCEMFNVINTVWLNPIQNPLQNYSYWYQLQLDHNITQTVIDNTWCVLRAFPAFESDIMPLPENSSAVSIPKGPYLLDWVSGDTLELTNGKPTAEYCQFQLYDSTKDVLTSSAPLSKNTLFASGRIETSAMLLWQAVCGTVNYDGNRLICTCNDQGEFYLLTDLTPAWTSSSPSTWRLDVSRDPSPVTLPTMPGDIIVGSFDFDSVLAALINQYTNVGYSLTETQYLAAIAKANTEAMQLLLAAVLVEQQLQTIKQEWQELSTFIQAQLQPLSLCVEFYPNAATDPIVILPGGHESLTFGLGLGSQPATAFEITASGIPGQTFYIGDMVSTGGVPSFVKYSIVARNVSRYGWAFSGLLCKPLFKSLRSLKVNGGDTVQLDGGNVML